MKKISRKGFLKVAAAAAMSGVTASALAACNAGSSSSTAASTGEAIYTPGTYTGTATGIGEVKVTMTFSETAITDVVIDASNETESIGGVAAPTLRTPDGRSEHRDRQHLRRYHHHQRRQEGRRKLHRAGNGRPHRRRRHRCIFLR